MSVMVGGCGETNSEDPHRQRVVAFGRAYADALLASDERAAEVAVREAMDAKLSTEEIDDGIIAPALWLIGELWQRGEISIADEHVATEISLRVLALQREARRVANARGGHPVLVATPAGEQHVVALHMVSNLLRGAGYDVVMLGADVPAATLGSAAARHQPDVICMSSTLPARVDQVVLSIEAVQRHCPEVGWVLGGRGLMNTLQLHTDLRVCSRVSEVVEAVDATIKRAALN